MTSPKYIVAHPGSLVFLDTIELARARGDVFRETQHVKIYEVREVEHMFPSGPKGPRNPGPPGTPLAGEPLTEVKAA